MQHHSAVIISTIITTREARMMIEELQVVGKSLDIKAVFLWDHCLPPNEVSGDDKIQLSMLDSSAFSKTA